MKTIICFFLILTISVATDVKVYVYNRDEFYERTNRTKPAPTDLFRFGYHLGDDLSMQIYLSFKDLNVSADLYVLYPPDVANIQKKELPKKSDKYSQYFEIQRTLNASEIVIGLELNTTTGLSTGKQIVKGTNVEGLPHEANDTLNNDICINAQLCVIEVDLLKNVKTENTAPKSPKSPTPSNSVLIYVIPSVILMCVIILVIYLSFKKKRCHQNSSLVESMELNTNVTSNEILYADLSLVHRDTQPRRPDEESPYAEIIGVLHSH